MRGQSLASSTKFLVIALGLLYALAAVGGVALIEFGSTRDLVLWAAFLGAGAALLLGGQFLLRPGVLSGTLICVGAALGGLPLFWTLLVPIAVAAVIACTIALTRRGAAPA